MSLTQKDREFILKLFKEFGEIKKDFKNFKNLEKRIKKLEDLLEEEDSFESPYVNNKGPHSIEVIFNNDHESDTQKRQVLIEAMYRTLKDLCDKNDIATLNVFINNIPQTKEDE